MSRLVLVEDILGAARTLHGVATRTPLTEARWLSEQVGGEVRLKCENLQRAGAFKFRGAYNTLARMTAEQRARGVITFSSGNHAQGTALAARTFGVHATVVMPVTAPAVKVEGARRLGAEVILEGTMSTQRQAKAEELAREHGYMLIPAFDHLDIIAGQGTVGVEILEDWPDVDAILVPIGGGGLVSGIAAWIKNHRPACRVIGVEPELAPAMALSVEAGHPVTIESKPTIADGLMPVRPGDHTFEHVRALVDDIVRVSDAEILDATRQLLVTGKLIVEFSGAAAVAALLSGRVRTANQRLVAVLSGGNLDPARMLSLMQENGHPA
jgi:threonine dehydratase